MKLHHFSLTRRRCPSWDLSSDVLACLEEARRELRTGVPSPRKGRAMDLARIVAREEADRHTTTTDDRT
jgi:hypothetical protein